jgi:hypothetical protein
MQIRFTQSDCDLNRTAVLGNDRRITYEENYRTLTQLVTLVRTENKKRS